MENLGSTEVIQTSDNERVTTHNGHLYQKFDTPDQNIQDNEPAITLSKTLVTDQKMSMEIEENKSMIRITIKNTSKSDKEVEFLITEEKFRSRSSSVSGGSNITIKLDNGLNCKIETKHSPASLPGTSSMQSPPSSTNEEFVETNEVGVRRRQLNLANGGNKMPIKEPKVLPEHSSDTVDFLRHQDAYKDRFVTVFNFEHIDDHSLRGTNSWRSVNAIRESINVKYYYNSFVDAFVHEIEKDMGDTIEISYRYSKFDGEHHIVYHIVCHIVKISKLK